MSAIDYVEFMRGMCSAPFDSSQCATCGGTGLKADMCCSGRECGCQGKPVDFIECGCGLKTPTDEQIKEWSSLWGEREVIDRLDAESFI